MAIDLIGESSMGHVPSVLEKGPFVAGSAGSSIAMARFHPWKP